MKRSLETAQIIAAKIKYKPENIVLDSRFVERNLGVMSGRPHDEVQQWFAMGQTPADGESSEAMYNRVAEGMAWLQSQPADTILLVSHGGPGRVIRTIIREEPHYSIDSLGSIGNAQILELRL
jgi:broad specificity phosphatase PhoE